MDDPERQEQLSAPFHEVETIIGGHAIRPLSLASYDVLLRTGNPLVKGEMPEDGTPAFTAALMGFVFSHCAPWPDVVRASFDQQRFKEESLIFCGGLTPADFQTARSCCPPHSTMWKRSSAGIRCGPFHWPATTCSSAPATPW